MAKPIPQQPTKHLKSALQNEKNPIIFKLETEKSTVRFKELLNVAAKNNIEFPGLTGAIDTPGKIEDFMKSIAGKSFQALVGRKEAVKESLQKENQFEQEEERKRLILGLALLLAAFWRKHEKENDSLNEFIQKQIDKRRAELKEQYKKLPNDERYNQASNDVYTQQIGQLTREIDELTQLKTDLQKHRSTVQQQINQINGQKITLKANHALQQNATNQIHQVLGPYNASSHNHAVAHAQKITQQAQQSPNDPLLQQQALLANQGVAFYELRKQHQHAPEDAFLEILSQHILSQLKEQTIKTPEDSSTANLIPEDSQAEAFQSEAVALQPEAPVPSQSEICSFSDLLNQQLLLIEFSQRAEREDFRCYDHQLNPVKNKWSHEAVFALPSSLKPNQFNYETLENQYAIPQHRNQIQFEKKLKNLDKQLQSCRSELQNTDDQIKVVGEKILQGENQRTYLENQQRILKPVPRPTQKPEPSPKPAAKTTNIKKELHKGRQKNSTNSYSSMMRELFDNPETRNQWKKPLDAMKESPAANQLKENLKEIEKLPKNKSTPERLERDVLKNLNELAGELNNSESSPSPSKQTPFKQTPFKKNPYK